jgi:uncharacterized protein (DUF488 family)
LPPVFTIGHSTRPLDALVSLLQEHAVDLLVDVRSVPRSRTNPQFNSETLAPVLAADRIDYRHMRVLGGLRHRTKAMPPSRNTMWRNTAFRNYADYAATAEFRGGLEALLQLAAQRRCAIMCAEAVWWRCHRRIITDYLLAAGVPVWHIMGPGKAEPASLTPGAQRLPDGAIIYPGAPEAT